MKTTILLIVALLVGSLSFGQQPHSYAKTELDSTFFYKMKAYNDLYHVKNKDILKLALEGTQYSPSEIIMLDSVVTYVMEQQNDSSSRLRWIYTYDSQEHSYSSMLQYRPEGSPLWFNYSHYFSYYNQDNLLIKTLLYLGDDQSWNQIEKVEFEYENGLEKLRINSIWNRYSLEWFYSEKRESFYDEMEKLTVQTNYSYDRDLSIWENNRNRLYNYDSEGRKVLDIGYRWNTDGLFWAGVDSTVWIYDNTVESKYTYYSDSLGWRPSRKTIDTWTEPLKKVTDWYQFENSIGWSHIQTEEYLYDDLGNVIASESYKYSEPDSMWLGGTKWDFMYNQQSQLLWKMQYLYIKSSGQWIINVMDQNFYDQFGVKYYSCAYQWDTTSNSWDKYSSQIYSYSSTSSIGDSELPHLFVQVFPNPCRNQISIDFDGNENECADYQIFSVTGKLFATGSVEKNKPISVEKLNSGLYLIQAQSGSRIYMGKFIKN